RAARVAWVNRRVVLDDVIDRGPIRFAARARLGDDATSQRELGVSEREAGGIDAKPDVDVTLVPSEVGEAVAVDVDDRQVRAFRDAEHASVARPVFAGQIDP